MSEPGPYSWPQDPDGPRQNSDGAVREVLTPDWGDVKLGFLILGVLTVALMFVELAVAILVVAVFLAVEAVAVLIGVGVTRSLSRGTASGVRWTVGHIGAWF